MPAQHSIRLWALLLLVLFLLAGISVLLWPLEPGAMALQFARGAQACSDVVLAWSQQETALYRRGLAVDFALIASYSALGLALGRSYGVDRRASRQLYALVLLAGACDTGENLAHLALLRGADECGRTLHAIASGLSAMKWIFLGGSTVAALRILTPRLRRMRP